MEGGYLTTGICGDSTLSVTRMYVGILYVYSLYDITDMTLQIKKWNSHNLINATLLRFIFSYYSCLGLFFLDHCFLNFLFWASPNSMVTSGPLTMGSCKKRAKDMLCA